MILDFDKMMNYYRETPPLSTLPWLNVVVMIVERMSNVKHKFVLSKPVIKKWLKVRLYSVLFAALRCFIIVKFKL